MSCHCNVNNQHKVLIVLLSLQSLEKCSWMGFAFHHCFVTTCSACLVFLCRCPQSGWWYHYVYGAHYCTASDSFCRLHHLEQPPLAHLLDELPFSSLALRLTNDFGKSDMVSCSKKKEWKLNPGPCRQSHLSSFKYWCPLCLWIIWLSSVFWPGSQPVTIGHLGQRPIDNVTLIDGFQRLIVCAVRL